MKRARTFEERCTQLGRIALMELHLTKRNKRSRKPQPQPRTNKAKRILWEYEKNVFGFRLSAEQICLGGEYKEVWETKKFTTEQFQGRSSL